MKLYYSYIYEIKYLPLELFYVGSRSNQNILKTFEDCYTDKYMGSSSQKEGPFSKKHIKENPLDYQKTILKVFYSENINEAYQHEHGDNGLIVTYQKIHAEKCLNKQYFKSNGEKAFSFVGQTHSIEFKNKLSNALKNKPKSTEHKHKISLAISGQNHPMWGKSYYDNKTELEKLEINRKKSEANKGIPQPTAICKYCQKICSMGMIGRWHNENCKSKPIL